MNPEISSTMLGGKKATKRGRRIASFAEILGMGIMILGIVLLFQPFYIQLFKWGFPFLLIGYTVYNVFAHIPK